MFGQLSPYVRFVYTLSILLRFLKKRGMGSKENLKERRKRTSSVDCVLVFRFVNAMFGRALHA